MIETKRVQFFDSRSHAVGLLGYIEDINNQTISYRSTIISW